MPFLLQRLGQVGGTLASVHDLEPFCAEVHRILGELMPAPIFFVALFHPGAENITFPFFVSPPAPPPDAEGSPFGEGENPAGDLSQKKALLLERVAREGRTTYISKEQLVSLVEEDPCSDGLQSGFSGRWNWLGAPLKAAQGQWIGAVVAANQESRVYTPANRDLFRFLTTQVLLAVERSKAQGAAAALVNTLDQIKQINAQLALVSEMGDILQSCQAIDEAFAVVSDYAPRIFTNQPGALFMLDANEGEATAVAAWRTPQTRLMFTQDECWALRRGRTHQVTDAHSRLRCQHIIYDKNITDAPDYACFPLTGQGQLIGVLYLQRASNGDAATGAGKILEGETRTARDDWGQLGCTVAERLALSLSNILLRETLRQQSVRDPLTGAYNRRYMEETLRRELLRAVRHKHSVGLIMLDIDQFKKINERHGHEVGDQLLRELGRYLMSSVRGEDVVCRFGEETFCVVMPGAALDDTIRRAEELRIGSSAITLSELMRSEEGEPASPERTAPAAVSSLPSKGVLARYSAESAGFPVDRSRRAVVEPIMISLGVAAHPHNGSSVENLLKSADLALQQAKSQGFNRVVAADSKGSGVSQAGKK